MLECRVLEEKRDQNLMMKHWSPDKEEMIGNIIFDIEEIEKVKTMITKMWHKRKSELKRKQTQRQQIREELVQRRPSETPNRGNSRETNGEVIGNNDTNGEAGNILRDELRGELDEETNSD